MWWPLGWYRTRFERNGHQDPQGDRAAKREQLPLDIDKCIEQRGYTGITAVTFAEQHDRSTAQLLVLIQMDVYFMLREMGYDGSEMRA
jgi:hypothetical protein